MSEQWKAIPGFEGSYEASSLGRIRSLDRKSSDGRNIKGKTLKSFKTYNGYMTLVVMKDGTRIRETVHRLVARAFIPNPEGKREVNHKNGIRDDNRVENLEWVTSSENKIHSYRMLNRPKQHPNKGKACSWGRKLTDEQAEAIRKDSRSCSVLAEIYGVQKMTISNIRTGKYYKTKVTR